MNKIITVIVFALCLISTKSISQNYVPFPDSGAQWVNAHWNVHVPLPPGLATHSLGFSESYCTSGEDTIINLLNYTKINYCNSMYKGAIRDNGGMWYYVPKDSTSEFLLYDFTAQAGDTVYNVYCEYGPVSCYNGFSNWTVDYVDSVFIGNSYRKRMYMEYGPVWIEGMGNTQGLFWEDGINVSNYGLTIHCFSINDTGLFSASPWPWQGHINGGPCIPLIAGVDEVDNFLNIGLHPNPAVDVVLLTIDNEEIKLIELYDATGKMIYSAETDLVEIPIKVESFEKGIYFIKVTIGNNSITQKLVKI